MDRYARGFTLIESLSVMAVVAVGVTVGLPAFGAALERQRVSTTLHLITADMAMARGTAIMRRTQVVVCPGDAGGCRDGRDWAAGWVVFVDPDKDRRPASAQDVLRLEVSPDGSGALRMPATRDFVRYQPDGRSANSNLTIRLCSGDALRAKVVVNNPGRVRTERAARPMSCDAG